ncbi:hypothetical protein JCM24511_05641 [Saitozyma sp. JCM 24511]|nr:hypothetical protein JCM24511_05641 [Saitozyma sp. JCM 24511]
MSQPVTPLTPLSPLTPLTPIASATSSPTTEQLSEHRVCTNDDVPVLTITPATLPLTPPLTPTPATTCTAATPTKSTSTSVIPTRTVPIAALARPASPTITPNSPKSPNSPMSSGKPIPRPPQPPTPSGAGHHPLHSPLLRHLALLHPNTPTHVRHFIATRLLSPDRPFGHQGTWQPVWNGLGDLCTAGVGYDAAKGTEQSGEGKRRDEVLQDMYAVARRSWGLLEMKALDGEKTYRRRGQWDEDDVVRVQCWDGWGCGAV